jgi:hypothetical protein
VGTKAAKAEPAMSRYVSDFIATAVNMFGHVSSRQTRGNYIVCGFPAAGAGVGSRWTGRSPLAAVAVVEASRLSDWQPRSSLGVSERCGADTCMPLAPPVIYSDAAEGGEPKKTRPPPT